MVCVWEGGEGFWNTLAVNNGMEVFGADPSALIYLAETRAKPSSRCSNEQCIIRVCSLYCCDLRHLPLMVSN